jgi:hypothetical protein
MEPFPPQRAGVTGSDERTEPSALVVDLPADHAVLTVRDEIDCSTAAIGPRVLVLDLSAVTYSGSVGPAVLLEAADVLSQRSSAPHPFRVVVDETGPVIRPIRIGGVQPALHRRAGAVPLRTAPTRGGATRCPPRCICGTRLAVGSVARRVLALIIATAVRTTRQTRARPAPTRARAGDHEGLDGGECGAACARHGCPRPGVLRPHPAGRDRRVAIRSGAPPAQGSNR